MANEKYRDPGLLGDTPLMAGMVLGGEAVPMAPMIAGVPDVGDVRNVNDVVDGELPMDNDDVIATLNTLVETCYDGEYGFKACTERTSAQNLKSVFEERMRDCASSAAELASAVVRLGGTPEDSGTLSGTVHRGWVAVRDMLTNDGDNDRAVLEECERGEDIALGRYRKALKEALPFDIRAMVERQMQGVQKNHDMIKVLRDGYTPQR